MPGAPNPVWSAATKTFINDLMIVRVPLLSGEGEMFFAKKINGKELEVLFFRRVGTYDNVSKNFTGYYESINMTNYVYHKIDYVNGVKVGEFKSQSIKIKSSQNSEIKTFESDYEGSWLGALWYCISNYILAVPKKQSDGGWKCYGLGGNGGSSNQNLLPGSDGGGESQPPPDLSNIPILVYPPEFPTPPPTWNPFPFNPGGGVVSQDPLLGKELAPENYILYHYWEEIDYDNNDYINPPQSNPTYNQDGYRKNGQVYMYKDGSVQNYTNDLGGKFAIFVKSQTGQIVYFPGATITDFGVIQNTGATTSNGGIHADLTFSLAGLQHEYGHFLQAQKYGSFIYNSKILPASLWNMIVSPSTHKYFWTEVEANQLSVAWFGPTSDIANDPNKYPR
ncbi:MAG: hypothetical protein NTZ47_07920 [Bacteroidetes bacterium]|nr:hypothetical protein [Bacteroidota bacterium]